ncbi:MAG: hypothetical protein J0I01_08235 [Stenotrophomonas nitritireducens]|uniref:hypothetical protein n=1 Tax=Stenotrophomonas nitritireducens TaxID=83617 RepID=UPI001AD2B18D|nr:hypothetical protein [Stenotrophomonas nitritireducens]MBN8769658.1 hypothetical protein [Stenotrophomonas sp.]MBN8792202.1 hypothetical protein [Stenotrophomonas nitritireducens]
MSFRQFPATDSNGESHVIIEFIPEQGNKGAGDTAPRYELDDGRHLQRNAREFTTLDGQLRLRI